MAKKSRNKAGRRAYLKKFSSGYVGVGRTPNINYMREVNSRMTSISQEKPEPPLSELTLKRWMNAPVGKQPGGVFHLNIMARLRQSAFHQSIDKFHYIVYKDNMGLKAYLFFFGNEFFWVLEDKILHEMKRSIIYNSKQRALMRWDTKTIVWVECVPCERDAKVPEWLSSPNL